MRKKKNELTGRVDLTCTKLHGELVEIKELLKTYFQVQTPLLVLCIVFHLFTSENAKTCGNKDEQYTPSL